MPPYKSAAVENCYRVLIGLPWLEEVPVADVHGEAVVSERFYDLTGLGIDLLHNAFAAERCERDDGTLRPEADAAAVPAGALHEVIEAVEPSEEVYRTALHSFLLVRYVEAEVSLFV